MADMEKCLQDSVIGIIGTGSMGGMLVRQFLASGVVSTPGQIIASNRTRDKLLELSRETGIRVGRNNRDVVECADIIFLCVKPGTVFEVLTETSPVFLSHKVLVSIAGDVPLADLASRTPARVARAIPSITSECRMGVSLLAFGERTEPLDRKRVSTLLGAISTATEVREADFEVLADLTSCAPAFIASLMEEFAAGACRRSGIPEELATMLVQKTFLGTSVLLEESGMSVSGIITRVATPGGITEEGIKVLRSELPRVFDEVYKKTLEKHRIVQERLREGR